MIVSPYFSFCEIYLFYIAFNIQGHIGTGSLRVEEPVHTSWSRFCTVNHWASASNYQPSNKKCLGQDSNWQPQTLKAGTLTATPLSPVLFVKGLSYFATLTIQTNFELCNMASS